MTGLVFAMEEEAKQVLSLYKMNRIVSNRVFYVSEDPKQEKVMAIIAGIGKVNAQVATSILIGLGCDRIINIGTCGCTGDLYKPGDMVVPNVFFDGDFDLSMMDTTTKDPAMVNTELNIKNPVICYSYSTFITDKRAQDGIVDMEAYAVVAQARAFEVPVGVIKIVSDGGDVDEFEGNVDTIITRHLNEIKAIVEGKVNDF